MIPNEWIRSATAVAETTPEGQKITRVVLEYAAAVNAASVTPFAFHVKGRVITAVTVSEEKDGAPASGGRFVTLELSPSDPAAATFFFPPMPRPSRQEEAQQRRKGPPVKTVKTVRYPLTVQMAQCGPLKTVEDAVIPADGHTFETTASEQKLVEDFEAHIYKDVENGVELMYNLFVPKAYDGACSLPLVVFIGDAESCSDDPDMSLIYTYGGVAFASPRDQDKHPAFVLVPQVAAGPTLTNDLFECTKELDSIVRLIDFIVERYHIDRTRIYTTGQSMGCMASCEMLLRRPELFAAALLVAGQWDPDRMETLTEQNMWIVVSGGDRKAFPIMNEVMDRLAGRGVKIARDNWNARMSPEELEKKAEALLQQGAHVLYTVLDPASVVLSETERENGGAQHMGTWPLVYPMTPLRDWLFSQRT